MRLYCWHARSVESTWPGAVWREIILMPEEGDAKVPVENSRAQRKSKALKENIVVAEFCIFSDICKCFFFFLVFRLTWVNWYGNKSDKVQSNCRFFRLRRMIDLIVTWT